MSDKRVTRRDFMKITTAGTAVFTLSPGCVLTNRDDALDPKGLPTRRLGKTGIDIPIIGLGTGSRFLIIDNPDDSDALLNGALDAGIFYWDTAAAYDWGGKISEERLGRVLKHRRREVWLSTKVSERGGDEANRQIERSLKRLQTDYLDELKIHSIESMEDVDRIVKKGNVYDVIRKWKEQGVVKYIGFSGHSSATAMMRMARDFEFDTMLIALNHYKDGTEMFEKGAIPVAAEKGMGILAMKVIRPRETITGISAEDLIRYALSLENVNGAILGMESLDILRQNSALARGFKPLNKHRMTELQAELKPFFNHENIAWMQPGYRDGKWA